METIDTTIVRVGERLRDLFVVLVMCFLLWEAIKEGCRKSIVEQGVKKAFFFNRWTAMIPLFLVAFVVSYGFLRPGFSFLGLVAVKLVEAEVKHHPVGIFLMYGIATGLVGLPLASVYFIFKFWEARLKWGAFLFFVLTLFTAALAFWGMPAAEGKVQELRGHSNISKSELVAYIIRRESVNEAVAEALIDEWGKRQRSERGSQETRIIFYLLVGIAALPTAIGWVKLFNLAQLYLVKIFHTGERG